MPSLRLHDLARCLHALHADDPEYGRDHPEQAMALHLLLALLMALLALATVILMANALSHF